jgi:hypothetical protein
MGRYNQFSQKQSLRDRETKNRIHPIWRGIGFALMVIMPVLSYFGSVKLLEENTARGWFAIPGEYLAHSGDPYLYVKIGLTLILLILLYGVISFVGVLIIRVFGPPRYGPLDVPPIKKSYGKKRWQ